VRTFGALPGLVADPLAAARELARTGKTPQALREYRAAWRIDPGNTPAINEMVDLLSVTGDSAAAVRVQTEALAFRPIDPRRHAGLATALVQNGRLDAAFSHFNLALRLDPGYAPAYVGIGDVWWERGDPTRAVEAYRRALALDPGSADALNKLGVAFALQGDNEGAAAHFVAALRLQPTSAEIAANLKRARAAAQAR
jgi:Flp pilus assembly protein TadD